MAPTARESGEYVESYYAATAALRERPSLAGDTDADVCVIGGGYTGVSSALHLAERGFDVVLLEAERLGWGASGRNGGHVGVGQRREQGELEEKYGTEVAADLWRLGVEANATVRSLIDSHGIDCDLKNGILTVAAKASHIDPMREHCALMRERYDYSDLRFIERAETVRMCGSARYFASVLDTRGAHLHPLKYLLGLADAAEAAGARLFEHSRALDFSDGEQVIVHTDRGRVRARHLVVGCNGYLGRLNGRMASRIMPINNFVLATEPLSEAAARDLIPEDVAIQDTLFVINYWKLSGDKRLLFGGGENYTSRFPRDLKSFVRKYMLRVYPQLEDTRIDYAWGGTLAVTVNRMPNFGRLADNVYYAQGYSGHGVPIATLAGKLIAEAIGGEPARFDLMAGLPTRRFPGGVVLRWPALVAAMSYYALRDRF